MKIGNNIFFQRKTIPLGEGSVEQYIIFENKRLFSAIIYEWEKVGDQMRSHSHAFNLWAFLLWGGYEEYVSTEDVNSPGGVKSRLNKVYNKFTPRFIGKDYHHQVVKALPNTWTILFTGPWESNWNEYFPESDTTVTYSWSREVVKKTQGFSIDVFKSSDKRTT